MGTHATATKEAMVEGRATGLALARATSLVAESSTTPVSLPRTECSLAWHLEGSRGPDPYSTPRSG